MRLPDFVIIGAAKAGTTTLFEYLCKHPQIYIPSRKEISFFSVDYIYDRGLDWYSSLFDDAKPGQLCGDASTKYSRLEQYPKTLERMVPVLKNPKFIYILRHPVDRAYSFYIHRFKGAKHKPELAVPGTFEEAIKVVDEFLDSSHYMVQIEQYLRYYPRESFLFLLMDDLIQNPSEVMGQVLRFIGADDQIDIVQEGPIVANKASDYPDWYVQSQLLKPIKSLPLFEKLSGLFPKDLRHSLRNSIYQLLKKRQYNQWVEEQALPPRMRPETRQMLLERFEEPNRRLAEFLGRDLSHWSQ
ncbi:MAG: sulfotransferase domain-containing protein [Synechococcales bacterium]|nr:sulfotransferase domain-containing protein [Synechococcales bacterium]